MTTSRKSLLTPKDLADAIGASESALRRWVDGGRIRMLRTAGGHRRIPLQEAIRFVRQTGATIVRPELLGLNQLAVEIEASAGPPRDDALFNALRGQWCCRAGADHVLLPGGSWPGRALRRTHPQRNESRRPALGARSARHHGRASRHRDLRRNHRRAAGCSPSSTSTRPSRLAAPRRMIPTNSPR